MKVKFEIEFELETNDGKKLSFENLKENSKNVVCKIKSNSGILKVQGKVKNIVNSLFDNIIETVEDYIDQKLAEEKEVGADDITVELFESSEEDDKGIADCSEDGIDIIILEVSDEDLKDLPKDDDFEPDGIIIIGDSLDESEKITFEEFLSEIVDFEDSDEEPDIVKETESFLYAIEYFVSDVSRKAFEAAAKMLKITSYTDVINEIEAELPGMTRNEIKKILKADFDNWVNVRFPDIKEDCPDASCIKLMKYWSKKYKEF